MSTAPAVTQGSRFRPAVRSRRKLRMAIDGPSGSGKTFTALRIAMHLGKKVAVIDSEHGSAELYAGESPDGEPWSFAVLPLTSFSPTAYTAAMEEAFRLGFDVVINDSLSHAWEGQDGALELVDRKGGNKFTAWKDVTPMHRRMVETIVRSPAHIITTMRSKTEYVLEKDANGKEVPRKIGMAPIQRPGMEYEFDVYGSLDLSHVMTITKSRCSGLDGLIVHKPGPDLARTLLQWLESGAVEAPTTFTPSIVSSEAVARIIAAIAELGRDLTKEKQAIFKRYAVPEFAQLTVDQAKDYEIRLGKDLEKKRKEKRSNGETTNAVLPGQAPQAPEGVDRPQTLQEAMATSPGAPVSVADLKPEAKCDRIVLEKIAAERELLFCGLGLSNAPENKTARDEKWKAILAKRNVTTAKDLTNAQAAELLEALQKKVLELHAAKNGEPEKK